MVEVVYQDLSNSDFRNYYIGIPKNWKYGKDNDVTVIVSDVCVVIPQTIAGATGELIVLRTLEAMMDANVINAGDIQKAIDALLRDKLIAKDKKANSIHYSIIVIDSNTAEQNKTSTSDVACNNLETPCTKENNLMRPSYQELLFGIVDSYRIEATSYVRSILSRKLKNLSYLRPNWEREKDKLNKCQSLVLLGTPAVAKAIKDKKVKNKKIIYSFVLFPEEFGLSSKDNFFGIRIFPVPQRTAQTFFSYTGLKRDTIAVPLSEKTKEIAKRYFPNSTFFKLIFFRNDIMEIVPELLKYKYIYIFPDPEVLKVVNLLKLMKLSKDSRKIILTSLPDLDSYGVNFIYAVDYNLLVERILYLLENSPKEKILPCPARVKLWSP
ncbi:MAG: hypothetical protein ABGX27_08430 [Desulfurobacteriaceae bacterium]